ncbi:MAG: DinB family protein, partial [Ignavibacteriaceae bacterium]
DWTIKKINEPTIKSILPEKGSIENCSKEQFNALILELEKCLDRKIKFIDSLDKEKMENKIYDDRFNDEVSIEWIILRGNIDHEIHHRGQIAVYLRMLIDKQ